MKQPDQVVSELQKKERNTFLTTERMSKKLEGIRDVMKEVLRICNFLSQQEEKKANVKSLEKNMKKKMYGQVSFYYETS